MISAMKHAETPEAFTRFANAMKHILTVPKAEILRREAAYKAKADQNPKKRGPKNSARGA